MDSESPRKSPTKASFIGRKSEFGAFSFKSSVLISASRFSRSLRVYELLAKASQAEPVVLSVPETLVNDPAFPDPVFLYTDKDGLVRCITGPS